MVKAALVGEMASRPAARGRGRHLALGAMLLVILSWWSRRALQDQALNLGETMPLLLVLKMKAMKTTLSRLQVHYDYS